MLSVATEVGDTQNNNGPGVIPSRRVVSADYWLNRV